MRRTVTDHIVENDTANQLTITVVDEPGQGGANHEYEISYPGGVSLDENGHNVIGIVEKRVSFQNGPIKEFGVNGVTQEALLAIVIDRLRSFQAGSFACPENEMALYNCKQALGLLQQITKRRIERGMLWLTVLRLRKTIARYFIR